MTRWPQRGRRKLQPSRPCTLSTAAGRRLPAVCALSEELLLSQGSREATHVLRRQLVFANPHLRRRLPSSEALPAGLAASPPSSSAAGSISAAGMDTARTAGAETAREAPDTSRSYASARSGGQTARSAFTPSQYSYRSRGSGGGVRCVHLFLRHSLCHCLNWARSLADMCAPRMRPVSRPAASAAAATSQDGAVHVVRVFTPSCGSLLLLQLQLPPV